MKGISDRLAELSHLSQLIGWHTRRFFWCAPVVGRVTLQLWEWKSLIQYWLTGDCGNACGYTEPYGWVPEAGCPVHDRYEREEWDGTTGTSDD